jgi:drug/metabolite transporter (DMT)-like permease
VLLVIPLSLLAALLFACAAAFQQRAAHRTARTAAAAREPAMADSARTWTTWLPVLSLLSRLLRDRLWLLGWVTNLAGFLAQAAALHFGSISVVQPLLIAQLLFALPLATRLSHRRLLPRDWFGAAAVCGGLAVLLSVRGAAPDSGEPARTHVLLATSAALVLVVGLVASGQLVRSRPQFRAALVSVAAGVCFCMSAVFITLTTADLINRGVGATATDWPGYALAGSTVLGLLLEQDAFAAGSLPTAVAAMTITNPVASYLAGVLAFNGTAPQTPGALAGVASAGLLVVVGVITLAQSPNVHEEYARPAQRPGQDGQRGDRSPARRPSGAPDSVG